MRYDLIRILIVDDNQHMRVLIREILRALGVKVIIEASNGAEGMQALRNQAIDVVMTDLIMQPVGGVDFVQMIRTSLSVPHPETPVIMITGHATRLRVNEARDAGVDHFLTKPLTARAIVERLHMVVEQPRPFISVDTYLGPDRRRRRDPNYVGPWRRCTDQGDLGSLPAGPAQPPERDYR